MSHLLRGAGGIRGGKVGGARAGARQLLQIFEIREISRAFLKNLLRISLSLAKVQAAGGCT